jgi:hypothetical protein
VWKIWDGLDFVLVQSHWHFYFSFAFLVEGFPLFDVFLSKYNHLFEEIILLLQHIPIDKEQMNSLILSTKQQFIGVVLPIRHHINKTVIVELHNLIAILPILINHLVNQNKVVENIQFYDVVESICFYFPSVLPVSLHQLPIHTLKPEEFLSSALSIDCFIVYFIDIVVFFYGDC